MMRAEDIKHLGADEQIAFLLAALNSSEARVDALLAENARIASDFSELAATSARRIADLESSLGEMRAKMDSVVEQIKLMNQRHFGSKSEKVVPHQISLFNDFEYAADPDVPEPAVDDALPKRRPRKRSGKPVIDYSKFETVVIDHVIPESERGCVECGSVLEEIKVEVTRRLRIVPAHFVVEEHRRRVYRCPECCEANAAGEDVKAVIVRAKQPEPPIPGSFATPSLIAHVINGKYANAMPLYRMESDFRMLGAAISRQNMSNWVINVHERWLSLIHARMKAELLSHDLIHADETVVQVLKEPGREAEKKSRMWLFCSSEHDVPVHVFEYHETRRKGVAQEFLAGWSGTLTTDGYQPYFNLGIDGITNTACLVHVRRYFAQIVKAAGGDEKAASVASVALEARKRIDRMFSIDSRFDHLAAERRFDERKAARDRELRPLMEGFISWAREQLPKATPRLALSKALEYAVTYWPYVMNVLNDGRLELSNNIAERAIKPFVIGRKNWLFSDTPRGAHASAAIYSVVATALANGLNPRLYVEWLLTEMPNAGELTDDVVDGFLPWSDGVPDSCRLEPGKAEKARERASEAILDVDRDVLDDEMANNEAEDSEQSS